MNGDHCRHTSQSLNSMTMIEATFDVEICAS